MEKYEMKYRAVLKPKECAVTKIYTGDSVVMLFDKNAILSRQRIDHNAFRSSCFASEQRTCMRNE